MRVTNYQMQHVLDCFSKKLSKARKEEKPLPSAADQAVDDVSLSAESLRQAALDKISMRIFSKIDEVRALTYRLGQSSSQTPHEEEEEEEASVSAEEPAETRFTPHRYGLTHPRPDTVLAEDGSPSPSVKVTPLAPEGRLGKKESWV